MKSQRKPYSSDFKAKVALEALKAHKTINDIALYFQVHPNQVTLWKKQLLEVLPSIRIRDRSSRAWS